MKIVHNEKLVKKPAAKSNRPLKQQQQTAFEITTNNRESIEPIGDKNFKRDVQVHM